MNLNQILERKGQFAGFLWDRPLKTRKGVSSVVTKEVYCVGRLGINNDNRAAVQEAREDGRLPSENQGLPWGKWFIFPFVIEHKGGFYIRIVPVSGAIPKVTYRCNGQVISKEEAIALCLASEFKSLDQEIGCMTIKVENLVAIN